MTTKQAPIGSGFGATTTARDVLRGRDLRGTLAIVTGGYAGIGLETTRALSEAGASVIVPARSIDKAKKALADVARVEIASLDLADPRSIDAFAAGFVGSKRPLHLLVNNAGIMATPLVRDARGFEGQLATNHLGHFQLTARLWPALAAAKGARVVALSSRGHARSAFDFEDPHFVHRPYDKWIAYGQSKTANVLFAVALDARGASHGVRAFAVHPGLIVTDLMRSMSESEQRTTIEAILRRGAHLRSTEQGAATSVWCATSLQLEGMGGVYCEDCEVAKVVAEPEEPRGVRPFAIDRDAAERLWTASERWTEVAFSLS